MATEKTRLSLKSWKLINENTLYLTHNQGVDTYQENDISEIEFEYSKKDFHKRYFVEEYFGYGLIGLIILPIVFAFFDRYPNKNYFEEFGTYFSFYSFLGFIFFLTPIGSAILGLFTSDFLVKTIVTGRELNVYSLSQGKKEYHIEIKDFENVMSADFFQILFKKSTVVNKIVYNREINEDLLMASLLGRTKYLYDSKEEFVGHVILFFLSIINLGLIYFFYRPLKLELIPLISIHVILFLKQLWGMIDSRKSVKFWKKGSKEPFKYIQIYENQVQCESAISSKSDILVYSCRIEDVVLIAAYNKIYAKTEDKEFSVYLDSRYHGYSTVAYTLLGECGMSYFINQQKSKGKWFVIFERK